MLPVDRAGPALTHPAADRAASLTCTVCWRLLMSGVDPMRLPIDLAPMVV